MSKDDHVEIEGVLEEALGGGQYRIKLESSQTTVRGQLSGKMKKNHIRVMPGDRVRIALSPYDMTHGIIVRRHR